MTKKNNDYIFDIPYFEEGENDGTAPDDARITMTRSEKIYADWRNENGIDIDDSSADWFCDGCHQLMNWQIGFTCKSGRWTCTRCGFDNDVSLSNIKFWV